jgi:hypothetical protein
MLTGRTCRNLVMNIVLFTGVNPSRPASKLRVIHRRPGRRRNLVLAAGIPSEELEFRLLYWPSLIVKLVVALTSH